MERWKWQRGFATPLGPIKALSTRLSPPLFSLASRSSFIHDEFSILYARHGSSSTIADELSNRLTRIEGDPIRQGEVEAGKRFYFFDISKQ